MQAATCTYLLASARPAGGCSLLPHSSGFKGRGKQEAVQMLRYIQKSSEQTAGTQRAFLGGGGVGGVVAAVL